MNAQDILERAPVQRVLELDPVVIAYIGDLVTALKRSAPAIIRNPLYHTSPTNTASAQNPT